LSWRFQSLAEALIKVWTTEWKCDIVICFIHQSWYFVTHWGCWAGAFIMLTYKSYYTLRVCSLCIYVNFLTSISNNYVLPFNVQGSPSFKVTPINTTSLFSLDFRYTEIIKLKLLNCPSWERPRLYKVTFSLQKVVAL
jgi:hypothetical protein